MQEIGIEHTDASPSTCIKNSDRRSTSTYFSSFALQGFPSDFIRVEEVLLKGFIMASGGEKQNLCIIP